MLGLPFARGCSVAGLAQNLYTEAHTQDMGLHSRARSLLSASSKEGLAECAKHNGMLLLAHQMFLLALKFLLRALQNALPGTPHARPGTPNAPPGAPIAPLGTPNLPTLLARFRRVRLR